MIPPLRDDLARPIQTIRKPSLAWGYIHAIDPFNAESSRINGYVDALEAVRQAVWHIVHTERYAYPVYPDNYGIELEQFIGESFAFFRAKIAQVMKDALMQDNRIREVILLQTQQRGPSSAYAEFEIVSVYGRIREGFEIALAA